MTERAVIVGGGIAGSVAALELRRAGVAVTVVEARSAASGGAVVRINPNGLDALRAIGAHQAVIAASFPLLRFEWYVPTGRIGYRMTADPSALRGTPRVMAWADPARVLQGEAARAGAVFRYDARVIETNESADRAWALLADGDTVEGV
ncbi:FAD-dependent oxidoreductase [Sciscionella marina]|uniref:FAD-dependent oxidoreductase n=1 Tax=Sciscionella marina TaxID=508770 RepID=UPI0012F6ED16|nr:FAD-dependent monooxygenase [Sciscionella marina]